MVVDFSSKKCLNGKVDNSSGPSMTRLWTKGESLRARKE